ncbi:hypothetical protein MICAC_4650001 [Microcystis aeruginosa PCC 9443]|uniref:Uncharacterized protein n=1 Tax=Microcystis aeruginosa PCC 9443 TaxID=1160281 RepID=I4G6D9_MICAE|nr:hypothetical protein MICAC_4650001 [Microcystis aeruginosa PCC 9443]
MRITVGLEQDLRHILLNEAT